jgi:RNA polymerase sigma-70 factor (ECF subfamily)
MQEDEPLGGDVKAAATPMIDKTSNSQADSWSALLQRLGMERDKAIFAELFRHFAPRVQAYIMRLGMPRASAEELSQEAMLLVWRKAEMYNPAKARASSWIFTLARNLCIDRMRKEKAVECELFEEQLEHDQAEAPEQLLLEARMQQAIALLPENQAQVLQLCFYEGKSHAEIAQQLAIPLGSVKSRMRLAFDKLKVHWGEAQ